MFAVAMLFLGIISTALLFGKLMFGAEKDFKREIAGWKGLYEDEQDSHKYWYDNYHTLRYARTQGISQVNKCPGVKSGEKEANMALVSVLGDNQQVAKIGWGGSFKVKHDFEVAVGSNTMTVTGVNGRYEFTNKRGNYSGSLTRRQILAMADAIRDAGEPSLA